MLATKINWIAFICLISSLLHSEDWNTVYLASFPRSGNHWVRFLVEEATHITTSSVYCDKDFPHMKNQFPWGGYCTDHGYAGNCRFPTLEDPVLIKTHFPFLTRRIVPEPKVVICLIRHPVDSFWSFHLYKGGNPDGKMDHKQLKDFISSWRKFYEYWENQPHVLFIRYEDLQVNTKYHLSQILTTAGYSFSELDLARAIDQYPSQGMPLKHLHRYDSESIETIRDELSDLLIRYGYDL